jgi:hypothetical protein
LTFIFFDSNAQKSNYKIISFWGFDEQVGLYPSSVLENLSDNDYPLVLGLGGDIVKGRFGNALEAKEHPPISIPFGEEEMGLANMEIPKGRKVEPLSWRNAHFCALMTGGENHLRKEIGFVNPTKTKLNLGSFDWTVEFWINVSKKEDNDGVVFEMGSGPRGENDLTTTLLYNSNSSFFYFSNEPSKTEISIPSSTKLNTGQWHHIAFTYISKTNMLKHFVDGKLISTIKNIKIEPLPEGDEDYFCIGTNGLWQNPLAAKLDELRFCEGIVYDSDFNPPNTFVKTSSANPKELVKGLPLLFDSNANVDSDSDSDTDATSPINLGNRKHLFIDDALIKSAENITFNVNPPRKAELVIGDIRGQFRKHLTVVEDEDSVIRIYNGIKDDYLGVRTSKDGIHFIEPDLGTDYKGIKNIVIHEPVGGMGNPFIDPNGNGDYKWKYITGYHSRGVYLYTSPDGYKWKREKMALIPFRSGTQSCTFYDDQRQMYVSTHRTGIMHTPGFATQRSTVITETDNLFTPIEFNPISQKKYLEMSKTIPLRQPLPWWLDNGPLTPGDFGLEFPNAFNPDKADPIGTDIYITKAIKYPYAPDTYVSFPIVYFHYENDGPPARTELMNPKRGRGEGPIETQIAVSRNGNDWKRYYRPPYVSVGLHEGIDIKTAYIAQGMIRRGNEIWQYYFGEPYYHSAYSKKDSRVSVFRLVQRLDGFISADSPYEKDALIVTKPLIFKGDKLLLNINTSASGYAQVGLLDEYGKPIEGFELDNCVYINGDFISTEVEWLNKGTDLSSLHGKVVQVQFRMRGSKLYAMQFTQ